MGYELNSVATSVTFSQKFAGNVDIQYGNITVADNQTLLINTVMGVGGIPMTHNDYTQAAPVAIVFTNATNLFTLAAHTFVDGDKVELTGTAAPTGLTLNTSYYIVSATTNTCQLSLTPGGSAIAISDDGTAVKIWREARPSDEFIGILQKAVTTSGATADIAVALTGAFDEGELAFGTGVTADKLRQKLKTYNVFLNPVTSEL